MAPVSALATATITTDVQVTVPQAEIAQDQVKAQEKAKRVLGVFPNFYVSYVPDAVPLTPKPRVQACTENPDRSCHLRTGWNQRGSGAGTK